MKLRRLSAGTTAWLVGSLLCLTGAADAANFTVNMSNFQFVPKPLTISVGDTVTWVNQDFTQHDTTSGVNGVPNGIWHSQLLSHGGSFAFTFNVPAGTYPYYCTPHVFSFNMVGTITVVAPNQPPSVTITNPADGASFVAGANIPIQAAASDADGSVTRVDFFANGAPIGSSSGPAFSTTFNHVAAGSYRLTAVAVDNTGATTTSAPVNIVAVAGNVPPSVSITNPVNGQTFFVGSNITVQATAEDSDGSVTQVLFQVNGALSGTAATPPFAAELANLPVGDYVLTAIAVDNLGATGVSAGVSISVRIPTSSPVIQTPPQSQSVLVGSNVDFSVVASGTEPLSYQWRFNGSDLAGATSTVLSLLNVQPPNSGLYSVLVTNIVGSVTSNPAFLQVLAPSNAPPSVTIISPTNGAILPMTSPVLLGAQGFDSDGSVTQVVFALRLSGSASNLLEVPTASPFTVAVSNLLAGNYVLSAEATDNGGATGRSAEISFAIQSPPIVILTRFPTNAALPLGGDITLRASVEGPGNSITNVTLSEDGSVLASNPGVPFTFIWRPIEARAYTLIATAVDQFGQEGISPPLGVRIFTPESTRPLLTITNAPRNFSRTNSPSVILGGTASDDVELDHVEYQINDGPSQAASGREDWLIQTNLFPGMNTIRVRSVDLAGNFSFDATRFVTYVTNLPLSVQIVGSGTLIPNLNGQVLEAGKVYKMKAQAAPNHVFVGWAGSGLRDTNGPILSFQMRTDLTNLVATFTNNFFVSAAGSYSGLFLDADTNKMSADTSGFITLRLNKTGLFTGKVTMNGIGYPCRGKFDQLGNAYFPVMRPTLAPVLLSLNLDVEGGVLSGFATNAVGTNLIISALRADKAANAGSLNGFYAFALQRTSPGGPALVANGSSFIDGAGRLRTFGALTDGTRFTLRSTLDREGESPCYLFTRPANSIILGWIQFGPSGAVGGELYAIGPGTNGTALLNAVPRGQ